MIVKQSLRCCCLNYWIITEISSFRKLRAYSIHLFVILLIKSQCPVFQVPASQSREEAELKKFHSDDREEIDNRRNLLLHGPGQDGFQTHFVFMYFSHSKTSFNFSLKCQRNGSSTQVKIITNAWRATDITVGAKLLIKVSFWNTCFFKIGYLFYSVWHFSIFELLVIC